MKCSSRFALLFALPLLIGCGDDPAPVGAGGNGGGSEATATDNFREDLKAIAAAQAAGDDKKLEEIAGRLRDREDLQKQLFYVWGFGDSDADGTNGAAPKEQRLAAAWLWKRTFGYKSENPRTDLDGALLTRVVDAEEDEEVLEALKFDGA